MAAAMWNNMVSLARAGILFFFHPILLRLRLDRDTFFYVFSWSQWVKNRHTMILRMPEIPSDAPPR